MLKHELAKELTLERMYSHNLGAANRALEERLGRSEIEIKAYRKLAEGRLMLSSLAFVFGCAAGLLIGAFMIH